MKGTFWKIDGEVTNPNLPYLNEISMTYIKTTTGVSKMQFALQANLTKNFVLLVGSIEGEFFSDAAATISLGSSITYAAGANGGQKVIYFKAYQSGTLKMRGGEQLTSLGLETGTDWNIINTFLSNPDNARVTNFNLLQLSICTNIKNINMGNTYSKGSLLELSTLTKLEVLVLATNATDKFTGSISALTNLPLKTLKFEGLDVFDIGFLPPTLTSIETTPSKITSLVNTGTEIKPALIGNIAFFNIRATNKLTTSETDKLLKALAASLPNRTGFANVTLTISGQRTTDSDAAVNTLVGKNFTVNLV